MPTMRPSIVVQSENASDWGRRVSIEWPGPGWTTSGDNSTSHGGTDTAPDGFGFMGAAFGICMVTTLIANAMEAQIGVERVTGLVSTKARVPASGAPHLTDFHVDIYLEGQISEGERVFLRNVHIESVRGPRDSGTRRCRERGGPPQNAADGCSRNLGAAARTASSRPNGSADRDGERPNRSPRASCELERRSYQGKLEDPAVGELFQPKVFDHHRARRRPKVRVDR